MDPQNPSQMPPAPPPYGAPPTGGAVNPQVRNLAIGLFVCAALVLVGTFTSSWMSASMRGADAGVGLTGMEVCFRGACKTASWSDSKAPADFTIIGYLGLLGGLASAAVGIAMGVFAITNKPNKIPDKIANGIFGVTAFAFTFFLIRLLTESKMEGMSISYSGVLGIGGIIGLGVVAKMIAKARGA